MRDPYDILDGLYRQTGGFNASATMASIDLRALVFHRTGPNHATNKPVQRLNDYVGRRRSQTEYVR